MQQQNKTNPSKAYIKIKREVTARASTNT